MKANIEAFRTPGEYLSWFNELIAPRIGEDKKRALLHVGLFKLIYEEIFPTASLLKHKRLAWKDSKFRNIVGSQPYDVEIENNALKYLEVTCTDFDDSERFRMQNLIERGHVNPSGVILRDRKGRPVDIDEDARRTDDVIEERIDLIVKAIKKKSEKEYSYRTGLIVYFDDFSIMLREPDLLRLRDALELTKPIWQPSFESVFLVGPRAEVLIEMSR